MPGFGGRLLFWFARGCIFGTGKLMFSLRFEGRSNCPRSGGVLIASNHASHLDPPLVGCAAPRIVFHMAKRELFKLPFLQWFMTSIGTIMVDRGHGRKAITDAVEYLKHGAAVVIFPEGTRSVSGVLMKGHSGAIVIAIAADCPILPAAIIGSEKAMTKGSKGIKRVPVSVRCGAPYKIAYGGDRGHVPREVLERETVALMERIEALLPEAQRPSAADKAAWYGGLTVESPP